MDTDGNFDVCDVVWDYGCFNHHKSAKKQMHPHIVLRSKLRTCHRRGRNYAIRPATERGDAGGAAIAGESVDVDASAH